MIFDTPGYCPNEPVGGLDPRESRGSTTQELVLDLCGARCVGFKSWNHFGFDPRESLGKS